ncbi:hypothetical protein V1525DRAFT_405626 [Lipomyces kononenkoae]|uniref:Uncharacterized protein n=1 Tax=Lipomyces kononenkoae TaxID=34357 RepID=A0ACC3SYZ8_LIPKO
MASMLGKMFTRRFLRSSTSRVFGTEDPYYEEIPQDELGRKKKGSKRRRQVPPGLSQNDAMVLTEVRQRAYRLDMSLGFWCCGIGIGWNAIILLIPGIGAAIAAYLSYCVVQAANKIDGGLPNWLYTQMMTNLAIDFGIGLVPLLGDVIHILYKANSRNALLLDNYLREVGQSKIENGNFVHRS